MGKKDCYPGGSNSSRAANEDQFLKRKLDLGGTSLRLRGVRSNQGTWLIKEGREGLLISF